MNNLPQEHLSSNIIPNSETSNQVAENNHQEGKVYFIRHGKSTSNERNIFAGVIDHRISEKSFGIFAGRNLNLLRLALGYEGFEEMLHSHNEAPPAGEKIAQVYQRASVRKQINDLSIMWAIFWAALGFFCIPLIEQILFMNSFGNELLRETLRSSRMATADKNGTVDLQELEDYVSTYGLVANLNVVSAAASSLET